MYKTTMQNTILCKENDDNFFKQWFEYNRASFINHIDTFYFLVKTETFDKREWNRSQNKLNFLEAIKEKKNLAENIRKSIPIFKKEYEGLEVRPFFGIKMYSYHFGQADNFDVFVCESVPNVNTPPIMVQIRSQALWLNGVKESFDNACECLEKVLGAYGIRIKSVQENRIDFAFHTNYIQDMINFFPERHLKEMQVSNFMRWHKEGCFYEDEIYSDYFTLGRRKSNNVFFRVYNKTKEVIEMGYKQFFIPIWLDKGLISKFDEFVLRKAFTYGSYFSKDKARCEFYLLYGKNEETKEKISKKLANPDTPLKWYSNTSKGLVPDVTIVTNVEIQTKRKFYDRISESIPYVTKEKSYKKNIYNLYEQLSEIIRFITHDTIRFVKYKGKYESVNRLECPYADWWQRLRSSKTLELNEFWVVDYYRSYQNKLDIERQKSTSINKMARLSAYTKFEGENNSTIYNDIIEFTSSLNDNDIQKYYAVRESKIKELQNREKNS